VLAGIQIYLTSRQKSETFGVITLVLLSVTAVISDSTHIMLPITSSVAVIAVVFFFRNAWWRLLFVSQFLVYIIFLFWFLNNPFMGHPLQVVLSHQLCYLYIFAIAAVYSLVTLIKNEDLYPGSTVLAAVIINGLGFSFLIMITTLSFFITNYNWIFLSVSAFCIGFSIYLKYNSLLKATPSLLWFL
jgi:hypothetical protein